MRVPVGRLRGGAQAASRAARVLVMGASTALVVAALAACGEPAARGQALPAAEFLFAAGDSTYWVRSGGEGMRVRSAPILLTDVDGRLIEVFLSDDGAEYPSASFATTRLWARALQSRDSTLLFADSTVMRELSAWRKANPRELEIDPNDDDAPDDPRTVVHDGIEIIDVHGPYLTFEHLLDADIDGGPPHQHRGRRYVVDVRSGHVNSLAELLGAEEARAVMLAAQASLAQLTDSIRQAGAAGDERAQAAVETLGSFVFDSGSFGITDLAREPAVAFMVPGQATDGEALALYLPPIGVRAPTWWPSVRGTLPEWSADSSRARWERGAYDVTAVPAQDGDLLGLSLSARGVTTSRREWPVATVAAPVYQLIALEQPPLDSAGRAALARAFDRSTALDGLVQRASYRRTPRRHDAVRLRVRRAAFSVQP
ncbi:hypothetical protein [Gemmatimonas sp.]|jgi:hypothetical protein|uniref:hypothetical protein n=2 Tax=Gemmatimonas sp. TaxID=1962908 RepID=UPI0025BE5ECF|nr:hypothetical protein [Gemmatimonas sp.]MCA2984740.1 hypothetical protein [Gemmatimonas sp.]MCA2988787.1 hypothetical protein [Gemmatimonas sp.]MCE2952569.1 hypothetical protein [Gemmatimonas sp.]